MIALIMVLAFFLFLAYLVKVIASDSTMVSKKQENANEIIDSVYAMLEKYGIDVTILYEQNVKELKELAEKGDKKGYERKVNEFKNNIRNSLVLAKKECENFKKGK